MEPILRVDPVVRSNYFNGPGSYYYWQWRSKQRKPYNLPAPYSVRRVVVMEAEKFGDLADYIDLVASRNRDMLRGLGPDSTWDYFSTEREQAFGLARASLLKNLGDTPMLATNFLEREQAINMIVDRSRRLRRSLRLARKGYISDAAKELGLPGIRSRKSLSARQLARDWSNAWLELHFGWAPLVGDIYNCVDVLQSPVDPRYIRGRSRPMGLKYHRVYDPGFVSMSGDYVGSLRVTCGCVITVTNPGLWTANRLGLVNPATIAWEAVPFSFVVDWFVNVNDVLGQFTDFWGCSISHPWTSVAMRCAGTSTYVDKTVWWYPGQRAVWAASWFDRQLDLPGVTLGMRPGFRLSVSRALTAVSLLVQRGFKSL